MSHPSAVSGAFGKPFNEQVAFFRQKLGNRVPTARWDDLTGAAHDSAFMVAGAMQADLLADLAAAVEKAISQGRGIEEFRKDFRAIVAKNGWTGWTGEGTVKGEAWRVKTILRTNAYTSYSAGRHAQLLGEDFPFWVYRHGGSLEPRPYHVSLNGLALPPAHPFWAKYYPPSDWGCSCYVLGARSAAGIKRLGGDPDKQLPGNWAKVDAKTGEPAGIGKGWGYAPGASVAPTIQAIAGKVGSWDYQVGKAFMSELPAEAVDALSQAYRMLPSTADDARRYAQRVFDPNPDLQPLPPQRTLGMVTTDQSVSTEKVTGIDVRGYDFSLDVSAVRHVIGHHTDPATEKSGGQRVVTAKDFAVLPRIAAQPLTTLGLSPQGERIVEQRLVLGGETYVARWAIGGRKRRTLSLKTMFIKIGGEARPQA